MHHVTAALRAHALFTRDVDYIVKDGEVVIVDEHTHMPLYIVYFTAYPNPTTGKVELWPDLYDFDKVITKEIGPFLLKE